jgi:hypothetical protein
MCAVFISRKLRKSAYPPCCSSRKRDDQNSVPGERATCLTLTLVKGEVHSTTAYEGLEGARLGWVVNGTPGHFTPGKDPLPIIIIFIFHLSIFRCNPTDVEVVRCTIIVNLQFVCLFSWRYNPLWLYFHSPVAGFSLLLFEVS